MLATELLFVYVYCLVDDAIKAGVLSIPRRPGPAPACTDAELLTIALGRRVVRAWSIVPAAVDERQIGTDLVAGDAASIDALLLDKGFTGIRFASEMASGGIDVIIPPTKKQRTTLPKTLQRLIARF